MGCSFVKPAESASPKKTRQSPAADADDEWDQKAALPDANNAVDSTAVAGAKTEEPERSRRRGNPNPRLSNLTGGLRGEQVAAGWSPWLTEVAGEAISGWTPRGPESFIKIGKIGHKSYSNVYKVKDIVTGRILALKKVRFDKLEPKSLKFMVREILILRRLDHPNVVKLEGLVTSRISTSLYLVFAYMEHDLAGLLDSPDIKFTLPQVKCYMHQLLSGLEHCHSKGVLHRDIKGSNLLLNNDGILKIADFGLANFYGPNNKHPMTNWVVTLWYRAPEIFLGSTDYGVGIDLWSAGCVLGELLTGKPIMPGRSEVEQLYKIFNLCGSPSEDYYRKSGLPNATKFRTHQPFRRCIKDKFCDFPSSLPLIETLLSIDPAERQTATAALRSEFFTSKPYPCKPSTLPKHCPRKEMDAKLRSQNAKRSRAVGRANGDGLKITQMHDHTLKAIPEAEVRTHLPTDGNPSEILPPPHQDGELLSSVTYQDPTIKSPEVSVSTILPSQQGNVAKFVDPTTTSPPKMENSDCSRCKGGCLF